jgi:hypothetical protein
MDPLSNLAPVDQATPLTLIQSASSLAETAIKASNPLLTMKWLAIIVVIIVILIFVLWIASKPGSSMSSMSSMSKLFQPTDPKVAGQSKPPAATQPTYTTQLTRAADDCNGHMIFTVTETNPSLQDSNSTLTYPTNVYKSKNSVVTNPVITVTAGGNIYKIGGKFGFIGTGELIWLTIAKTDLPTELLTVPGPWTIKADFVSKHGESKNKPASNASSVVGGGLLDSTFDSIDEYCPYAAWRS